MSSEMMVKFEVADDGVATLTLNRPHRLNAFTVPMIDQWSEVLDAANENPAVKVIVLTGAGRAFCAGGDVDDIENIRQLDAPGRKDYLWRHVHNICRTLERMDKPIIAAINGPARGAGVDMALMCDLRLMASSANLAEAYINLGLIAGDAGTWFLPRLIGPARALELFWTGRVVSAVEAERFGIVNEVVEDDKLIDRTYELARLIASQPQDAVQLFKRAVYQGLEMERQAHLDMISSHMSILMDTPEHRDRVAALKKKK